MTTPPINILIVEDNLGHLKLTRLVLQRNQVNGFIHVVRDGQEALDYLYHRGSFADPSQFPTPQLVLLDFNLPKRDGREVLRIISEDPNLKVIPLIVISSSDRQEDIAFARVHGAVAYVSKSAGFARFNDELFKVTKEILGV